MAPELTGLLDGLHFHTLCEQDADALESTLAAVEERFGDLLAGMRWINFGGGHHITRPGYDLPRLERCITRMQQRYGLTVYLEPGEACALNAGYLVTEVLDLFQSGETRIAILDASAACHMPDVIEMPYRPPLFGEDPQEGGLVYRLGGPTCKNNTFNGMPLPAIYLMGEDGGLTRLASFGYDDFKYRLGSRGRQKPQR